MRLAWAVFGVFCGCASLSGLDQLQVTDAGDAAAEDQSVEDAPGADGDAALEASTGGSSIKCGAATCVKGVCCRTLAAGNQYSYACIDGAQGCAGVAIPCDSEDDCPAAEVCCITEGSSQQCSAPTVACSSKDQCLAGASSLELCSQANPTCSDANKTCKADTCLTGYSSCQ